MVREKWAYNFDDLFLDPFLYGRFNLAILQSLGKSPEKMEVLHISVIGFARIFIPSLKNICEILSIPAAFQMSVYFKISKTLFSVVKVKLKLSFSFAIPTKYLEQNIKVKLDRARNVLYLVLRVY